MKKIFNVDDENCGEGFTVKNVETIGEAAILALNHLGYFISEQENTEEVSEEVS